MRWIAGACTLAGDQTRGGKAPDYAPPLANVATPNAVVTKGLALIFMPERRCKSKAG